MLYAEHGLRFTKEGDRWRCVEHPDLVLLRGERRRVGERKHGSLEEVQDELRHIANRVRLLAVSQEVAKKRYQYHPSG